MAYIVTSWVHTYSKPFLIKLKSAQYIYGRTHCYQHGNSKMTKPSTNIQIIIWTEWFLQSMSYQSIYFQGCISDDHLFKVEHCIEIHCNFNFHPSLSSLTTINDNECRGQRLTWSSHLFKSLEYAAIIVAYRLALLLNYLQNCFRHHISDFESRLHHHLVSWR